ncbi:MAG TPA: MogA/MoaB family molybdenum cofactor biosynthesis protein [Solirubrobacterales bacterium]|nr:MogA/MoaB family molybdenum cofactor biosynthesis protein [Solirubrobacterales bacterium]
MTGAPSSEPPRVAVLTVSTSRAEGGGSDESGDALVDFVAEMEGTLVGRELVADDREEIEACLRRWAEGGECDLVLTTGGTGFSPSDVTPEATEAVVERRAPGIAEAMRAASAEHTPHWMLSRATAGIRGGMLIVNFPGNPKAIAETAGALRPALPHAVSLLRDAPTEHRP